MKWNEAILLLETCEHGLRKLVGDAATQGDYADVLRIADLAKAVAALASEGRSTDREPTPSLAAGLQAKDSISAPNIPASIPPGTGRRSGKVSEMYPKFFRRGDELVKVGWSKKDRKEYNHRAPRRAVDAVAAAVRQVGAKGKMFNGDALLPLKDSADNSAIPDYQAYVSLAWLRHLGVVEQQGRRGGYTLVPQKQIDSTVTAGWPELAEWRG